MTWNCNRCDFEIVEIQKDTIVKIYEEMKPIFIRLPEDWELGGNDWIQICPRCNSYPLGFKTEKEYPIRIKSGQLTTINDLDFVKAHDHTEYQKEILSSEICGCFRCCQTFSPDEIDQWHGEDVDGVEPLALCPKCSIDSVIGSASEYPIEESFLKKMRDFWFSPSVYRETMGN